MIKTWHAIVVLLGLAIGGFMLSPRPLTIGAGTALLTLVTLVIWILLVKWIRHKKSIYDRRLRSSRALDTDILSVVAYFLPIIALTALLVSIAASFEISIRPR